MSQSHAQPAIDRLANASVKTLQQAAAGAPVRMRIGKVVSVSGARVLMMIDLPADHDREHMPRIGDMICIETGQTDIIASVSGLSSPSAGLDQEEGQVLIAELGIVGELHEEEGSPGFRRGITSFPALGDIAASLTLEDRAVVYGTRSETYYAAGHIADGSSLPAMIDARALLESNFALIGMTGTGKSCAVASLVRTLVKNRHPCRTVIIDLHNEYSPCFGKVANVMSLPNGMLAHWMLTFRELVHLFNMASGRMSDVEMELLAEAVCAARRRYLQANPTPYVREGTELSTVTVDMPLPYRISDVVGYLDRSSHTDQRYGADAFRRLRGRLVSVTKDHHCRTFFGGVSAKDTLSSFLSTLFRVPVDGKPITVLQLARHSPGVTEVIVSAVARYMHLIAGAGEANVPFLLMLEDAHRFLPANPGDASLSTRTLSGIIEKTGKNNLSIGMITSQPRSLGAKAWEYCNTLFAMRLASAGDREVLSDITPENASDTLSSVGILGNGEAIAVGQGVPLPMRFEFRRLPEASVPAERAHSRAHSLSPLGKGADQERLGDVLDHWRFNVEDKPE